jgi:tetratricopeptide (TPR) repeat protein
MRHKISIVILLSIICVYLNSLRLESFLIQPILISDLANNSFSFKKESIENLNTTFPSLAINTIPLESIKSRYYLNLKLYDKAIKHAENGVIKNPYLAYTNYFLARVYIKKNDLKTAKNYLDTAYKISPNIIEISELLFALERILKK